MVYDERNTCRFGRRKEVGALLLAFLVGFAAAAACFLILLLVGLEVPLMLACSAAVGCAIFLLALSVVKLSSQGRGEVDDPFPDEEDSFQPPKVVTLKSISPEQLEREKRERLIRELEEKNREAQRRIAALKKRGGQ